MDQQCGGAATARRSLAQPRHCLESTRPGGLVCAYHLRRLQQWHGGTEKGFPRATAVSAARSAGRALSVAAVDQQCAVRQDLAAASTRTTALLGGNATRRMRWVRVQFALPPALARCTVGNDRCRGGSATIRTTALLGGNATGRMGYGRVSTSRRLQQWHGGREKGFPRATAETAAWRARVLGALPRWISSARCGKQGDGVTSSNWQNVLLAAPRTADPPRQRSSALPALHAADTAVARGKPFSLPPCHCWRQREVDAPYPSARSRCLQAVPSCEWTPPIHRGNGHFRPCTVPVLEATRS